MKHRYICIAAALLAFGVTGVRSSEVQTNAASCVSQLTTHNSQLITHNSKNNS